MPASTARAAATAVSDKAVLVLNSVLLERTSRMRYNGCADEWAEYAEIVKVLLQQDDFLSCFPLTARNFRCRYRAGRYRL